MAAQVQLVLVGVQESTVSAFSQWRAAASDPNLAGFLTDTAVVRSALLSTSKSQATASQLSKTIADKTEAGTACHSTLSDARTHQTINCEGRC